MTIGAEEGHLLTLSIAAGSQRKGWGERLLREFIHLAKERLARTMFLDVRESNRAAARLYERLGFSRSANAGVIIPPWEGAKIRW